MADIRQKSIVKSVTACIFCGLLFVLLLLLIVMPDKDFSETEKRVLSEAPKLSWKSVVDGSFEDKIESYTQDQMPLRNLWVGLGSYFNYFLGQNGTNSIYIASDGYLMNTPCKMNERNLNSNLRYLSNFAEKINIPCYMMPVPQTGYVLEDKLPKRYEQYLDDVVYSLVQEKTADHFTQIDLRPIFFDEKDKIQIYYKTDHHWTSDGAFLAANAFLQKAGKPILHESDFEVEYHPGFYGTTYSKAALWCKQPDVMALWSIPEAGVHTVVQDLGKTETMETDGVFFRENLEKYDMYPTYLGGNHSFTHIVNPNAPEGTLLMLKDSFGNTLATELAAAYSEIIMVDLRYYRTQAVSDLIAEYNVDTLLVNYSVDSLINDTNILFLK